MFRLRSLDALRGVAAMSVVIFHLGHITNSAYLAYADHPPWGSHDIGAWLLYIGLRVLISGPGAVLIFFVLSGLVLALSYVKNDRQRYAPYLIKRVARIWLPFVAVILISAALQLALGASATPTVDLIGWTLPVTPHLLAQHLGLIYTTQGELDPPMWTLTQEMRISIIFPLIVLGVFRFPKSAVAASLALVAAGYVVAWQRHNELIASLSWTAIYIALFAAGAAMARHLEAVQTFVNHIPRAIKAAILIGALAALQIASTATPAALWHIVPFTVGCLGAITMVLLCTTQNALTRALETPLPSWLGRVSYSLYLIHMPMIFAVWHAFPAAPFLLNAALTLALSLAASELLYRFVEVPSMALGRWTAHRVEAA